MGGNTVRRFRIKIAMGWSDTGFFSEKYRVVAVEAERLTVKGIITGTVPTIINSDPATPLTAEQYPLGKLIALSDPSASAPTYPPLPRLSPSLASASDSATFF